MHLSWAMAELQAWHNDAGTHRMHPCMRCCPVQSRAFLGVEWMLQCQCFMIPSAAGCSWLVGAWIDLTDFGRFLPIAMMPSVYGASRDTNMYIGYKSVLLYMYIG